MSVPSVRSACAHAECTRADGCSADDAEEQSRANEQRAARRHIAYILQGLVNRGALGCADAREQTEVRARGLVPLHGRLPPANLLDRGAQVNQRVVEARNGPEAGRVGRHQSCTRGKLFGRRDVHACDLRTVARRAAPFGHRELRVDLVEVLADHVVDADSLGSASSPDSARKMTSRSSGTPDRFSSSMAMRFAVSTGLSSLLPRPRRRRL
jgi:hypothetical protein